MIDFETEIRQGLAAVLPELAGEILQRMQAVDLPQRTASGVELVGYSEEAAAEALSVPRSVLRDLRLAGRIKPAKLGRRWIYSRPLVLELAARGVADAEQAAPVASGVAGSPSPAAPCHSLAAGAASARKRKGAAK